MQYILRPPYLYGPMNNVYREAFVFECAMKDRKFFLPRKGEMKLQFFYIEDLCKMMEKILEKKPQQHIFNVGNEKMVSIREWVELCYKVVGKKLCFEEVMLGCDVRKYFSFYDYEYRLDVTEQQTLLEGLTPLEGGLRAAWLWYKENEEEVRKKDFIAYIDEELKDKLK